MKRKAPLARTLADHETMLSTPPQALVDNPGKTLAETMGDSELLMYLRSGFSALVGAHQIVKKDLKNENLIRGFKTARDDMFAPDLEYLRSIGRLPEDFNNLDLLKHFPVD